MREAFAPAGFGRRLMLRLALAFAAAVAVAGHAPYGQWNVYRKRNLLILTSRADAPTFPLGKRVAEVLAAHLPSSKAQVSRAPTRERVASLISTEQMDVAVMSPEDAAALGAGHAPFAAYGPVPLRLLAALDGYLLLCREDFPAPHAYLVAATLSENRAALGGGTAPLDPGAIGARIAVPVHRGARAYFDGRPPPED